MKRVSWLFILAALSLLCGCASPFSANGADPAARVELPAPAQTAPAAPVGDAQSGMTLRETVYYLHADGERLAPEARVITVAGHESALEKLAAEALLPPAAMDAAPVCPDGTRLGFARRAMNACTVNLLPGGALSGEAAQAKIASAMASTLLRAGYAESVNVLWAGRALSLGGQPIGALDKDNCDLATLAARADGDTRLATLYYPLTNGEFVAPETREIALVKGDPALGLLRALAQTPALAAATAGIPLEEGALARACAYTRAADGMLVADIDFSAAAYRALLDAPMQKWQFLASVALTVTTFCPDTDGVRVSVEGNPVTSVEGPSGETMQFPGGVISREDFAGRVCEMVTIYRLNGRGGLAAQARALRADRAQSLRARLALLIEAPEDGALASAFPEGIAQSDILGVTVKDRVALVNLSSEFYRLCQPLNAKEEALMVFSLVNTLAEDARVGGVRLYIDGEPADTLAGSICIRGVLLPNPGLTDAGGAA